MGVPRGNYRSEEYEWISNRDLVDSAHLLLGSIDLDPASSKIANEYVGADKYYTPTDDGLNAQEWHGNVYLFPPSQTYFWHKQSYRWKPTRGLSPTLTSGHAIWWKTLKRKWLEGKVEQAIYYSNFIDMTMYCQDIFDYPVCIMKSRPTLIRHYYADDSFVSKTTGTSIVVYLQPHTRIQEATSEFIDLYSEKGRILV
jgi:hypothetical protein|tara:strand:- start:1219 stop:1812 length:594 start_codon:yes stop_codon:yes gene_type:complete